MDARHVFVSYAAEDREAARTLSEALVRRGYAVWWDRLIAGGALWGQEIERAIAESWAVIVLWSDSSVRSDYVRAEARSAAERHILIPAFIGPCDPPMPFGEYQTLDLTAWDEADPDALDGVTEALERLRRRSAVDEPASPPPRTLDRQGASRSGAFVRYWTELFQLAAGPKTFLQTKWLEADRLSDATRFYLATAVLKLIIGLPLALKIGGGAGEEILGTFVYGSIRMLALGAVVHAAWRMVGGSATATATLTGFTYVYSLQILVFECTQGFAVGLLRMAAPSTADTIFREVAAGRGLDALTAAMSEHLVMSALLLALACWPLFAVPFACWGAFRIHHRVSRARSVVALALAALLGLITYGITGLLSSVTASPG